MINQADRNQQVTAPMLEHRAERHHDPGDEMPDVMSPQELADFWGIHVQTIRRDIKKGALKAFRLPGGDIRIRRSDARRYGRPIE